MLGSGKWVREVWYHIRSACMLYSDGPRMGGCGSHHGQSLCCTCHKNTIFPGVRGKTYIHGNDPYCFRTLVDTGGG